MEEETRLSWYVTWSKNEMIEAVNESVDPVQFKKGQRALLKKIWQSKIMQSVHDDKKLRLIDIELSNGCRNGEYNCPLREYCAAPRNKLSYQTIPNIPMIKINNSLLCKIKSKKGESTSHIVSEFCKLVQSE